MTRRQIHVVLLLFGAAWLSIAYFDAQMYWLDRSDVFLVGMVTIALGLHGLWKTSS